MKLTRKRRAWAEAREDVQLKGDPLRYPVAPAVRYEKALDVLIREMRADYQREVLKLWRQSDSQVTADSNIGSQMRILFNDLGRRWSKRFADRSTAIAEGMIKSVDRDSKGKLKESLRKISGGLAIRVPDMPGPMAEVMRATLYENVSLIKNIQSQYAERLEGVVYRSIQGGGRGAADIYDEMIKAGGITERRAHTISTDQVRKATTAFNAERAKSVGIKKMIWRHSGGSAEPRRSHVDFDGREFDLNDPPAIGANGEKVLPGQEINCRCTMSPVISFDEL